jgi:YVTN family beta-propeller protein
MKKATFILSLITIVFTATSLAQISPVSKSGDPEPQTIRVEKGKTLSDFIDINSLKNQKTDINPGIDPEGDYMLRSAFSTDGTKLFVVTGNTNNVTVYDFETMTPVTVIPELTGYPVDIAVTDDYAVVGCLASIIYVIDLSDYSIAAEFAYSGDGQAVAVETTPDGNYAYVAFDVSNQLAKIDLVNMEIENTFIDFPVQLLTFSFISTGGRTTFKHSRFLISPVEDALIVGDGENSVIFFNSVSGGISYSVDGIPNCNTVGLSGDGLKTIALGFDWNSNVLKVFQIDNVTHTITGTVEVTGYSLMTNEVAVNYDGSKAYIGVSNNSSALIRFETSDFQTYSQNYTPFWLGTSPDHNYALHGQNRFSIFDFESESFSDHYWGNTQTFGAVSPVEFKVAGYGPLRYEGVYFYDCTDPENIDYKGKELAGYPPEGDTPYRIAISPDGTKAVTINNISENVSIIDLQTYTVDTIIDMGENCWEVAITHDSQWAILGGYDQNSIKIIDLTTYEFVASVTTGQRPMMLQISPDDNYVYVGNLKGNSVSIVELDGANSQLLTTIPTGVIGISFAAFGVKSGVELDPTGQYLLVAASFDDKVQVIDVEQQQIVADLPVGSFPLQIAFNETGETAVVTNLFGDSFSVIHVDGAASSVVGTYSSQGQKPLRLAYNPVAGEFGIVVLDSKKVINVDAGTGTINSTDYYSSYGSPVQIKYDVQGKPLILIMGDGDNESKIVKNKNEVIDLPATPTYFSYCDETNVAAVCMPGPDFVSVIEYELNTNPPVADFEANVTTINAGDYVEFTDLSGNDPTGWEWSFEGGTPDVSTEQNPAVQYEVPGSFDVTLTATNSYGSDTKTVENYITVDTLTFVNSYGETFNLTLFPNPVSDKLYLTLNKKSQQEFRVAVFDVNGKLLFTKELSGQKNEINMEELKAGVYILKIVAGNNSGIFKVTKK